MVLIMEKNGWGSLQIIFVAPLYSLNVLYFNKKFQF